MAKKATPKSKSANGLGKAIDKIAARRLKNLQNEIRNPKTKKEVAHNAKHVKARQKQSRVIKNLGGGGTIAVRHQRADKPKGSSRASSNRNRPATKKK